MPGQQGPGADSYALYNGTSMATPHVSGVVALMLSVKPTLTPDQVTSILQSTARAFPATCSQCGSGIVNANAAVDAAIGGTTPPDPPGTIAEVEPNNSRTASQLISTDNTTVNGTIGSSSDNDYYRVTLPAGGTLVATLTPNASSDYDLYRLQQQRRADRQQRARHGRRRHGDRHEYRHQRVRALRARGLLERRHGRDQRQLHREHELVGE